MLHSDEGVAFGFVDFSNRADIWVGKRRRRTRLLKRTLPSFGIRTQFRGEKFKRDRPLQLHILGFINNPHTAVTNLFEDAVLPSPVTWPEHITSDANRSMARWWKTWRA